MAVVPCGKAGEHLLGEGGEGRDEAFSVDIRGQVKYGEANQVTVAVLAEAACGGIWKSVRVLSPRPDAMTQGILRAPLEADDQTVLLLDFSEPVDGWMENERYGEGAFPGQGEGNKAAWFASPDKPRTGIRTGVRLPVTGTIECWVKPTGNGRMWLGCQPWWVKDKPDDTAWYVDLNFHGLIDDFRASKVARREFEAVGG